MNNIIKRVPDLLKSLHKEFELALRLAYGFDHKLEDRLSSNPKRDKYE